MPTAWIEQATSPLRAERNYHCAKRAFEYGRKVVWHVLVGHVMGDIKNPLTMS